MCFSNTYVCAKFLGESVLCPPSPREGDLRKTLSLPSGPPTNDSPRWNGRMGGQKMPLPAKKVSKWGSERWAPWVDTADMEPCFGHANEFWNYYRESGVGKLRCQGDELSFSVHPSLIGARGMERAESGNQKFRNFPRSSRDEKSLKSFPIVVRSNSQILYAGVKKSIFVWGLLVKRKG